MKNINIKRVGAGLVSLLVLFSELVAFSGCKKKIPEGVKTIARDSAWFNTTTSILPDVYKDKKTLYYNNYIIGTWKDYIVFKGEGMYSVPEDFNWETDSDEEYHFYNIDCYDMHGELVKSIDVSKSVSYEAHTRINEVIVNDAGAYLDIADTSSGAEKHYWATVDLETGEISGREETVIDLEKYGLSGNTFVQGIWKVGEYTVTGYQNWDSGSFFFVISKNGQSKVVNLSEALPSADIFLIFNYLPVSDTEMLLMCAYSSVKFVSLNLETGEVQNKDEEFSWLESMANKKGISTIGGKSYISDQNGIKRIDFTAKEIVDVLSFNECNINRYLMNGLSLLSVNEDTYVFMDEINYDDSVQFDGMTENTEVPTLIVLEKADKNPNAGKMVITAASVGDTSLTYPICEAIRIFNDTNKDYFIQMDYSYDISKFTDYSHVEDDDERKGIYYVGAANLYDKLAIDMISGDGPDIILNAGDILPIQTSGRLLDLNNYISGKNGIHEEDYFTNVIDAAKVDGKLLYMPVSFNVLGIPADISEVREGQIGFTYDEYLTYLNEVSGTDPMADTRLGILCTLYPYVSASCISGDTVNFDNEPFRRLCEYVKDNIPELAENDPEADGTDYYFGFADFLRFNTYFAPKRTLLGYPSIDGRGPVISVETSIGISAAAHAVVADGAWEFIKSCLGEEIQDMISKDCGNPMNMSVFDSSAEIILETYNRSEYALGIPLDESVITLYKNVLQSASVIDNADPTVLSVICEELPAYFLDQKSLDAVLEIMKNRVTTIINERGRS